MRVKLSVVVLALAASFASAAQPMEPPYQAVDLHPAELTESWACGVDGAQQVGCGCYGVASSSSVRAMLWHGTAASAVDLHPAGFTFSRINGIDGGQQVGWGNVYYVHGGRKPYLVNYYHAVLWTGSAASAVDLHPAGFGQSWGSGVGGGQQVGYADRYYYVKKKGGYYVYECHALLWTGTAASVVDLHPAGFTSSYASGVSGGQQVGWGIYPDGDDHALLWMGSAASAVDLHPVGFSQSWALGVGGGQQAGYGVATEGNNHALLWTRSAASALDLHPAGFTSSVANGANGLQQVGYGFYTDGTQHALVWTESAASVVDLNTFLPTGFTNSVATGIDAAGDIVGYAWGPASFGNHHAFLWEPK